MDMISIRNGLYDRDGFRLVMDFAITEPGLTAVLGPSGAGKSTLLNVLAGFEALAMGTVTLAGADHSRTKPSARPVNFVFQDNNCFAHMTARNNVALGVSPSLRLDAAAWTQVDGALESVGIAHLKNRKPGGMSGGERQRIALARVLVRQQPILLLDEAFAALGPALRRDMLELVKRIQVERKLTVLMVTHQPEDAKLIADQILFVANGKVQGPMKTDAFFASDEADILAHLGEI